jgi:hypothetical protein
MEEIRVGEVSARCWLGRANGAMRPRLEAGGSRQSIGSEVVPSGERGDGPSSAFFQGVVPRQRRSFLTGSLPV